MSDTRQEISNNLYSFYDHLSKSDKVALEKEARWTAVINAPGTWPRIIYRIFPPIVQKESSLLFSQKIQSGTYPEMAITGDEDPGQTDPFLRSQGYYPYAGWKGMAMENFSAVSSPVIPQEVEVIRVQSPEEINEWIKIVTSQLISPARLEQTLIESLVADPDIDIFTLRYQAQGVSTILVYRSATSTGLYMIVTHPSAQGKGFASLLIRQVIYWESEKSQKPIILQATPKGEIVYSKLGFLSYNQFFLYRYLNSTK